MGGAIDVCMRMRGVRRMGNVCLLLYTVSESLAVCAYAPSPHIAFPSDIPSCCFTPSEIA